MRGLRARKAMLGEVRLKVKESEQSIREDSTQLAKIEVLLAKITGLFP